jgi:uncharacterized protein YecE (DUF72 family)
LSANGDKRSPETGTILALKRHVDAVKKPTHRYWIGCSGWFYWHWRDDFYKGLPTHKWFEHYSSTFRTVELNAPFYSWPKPATIKTWLKQAPRGFRYCIKVNQLITHEKRFQETSDDVTRFCDSVASVLGPRLGCFLFQLPPSVHYDPKLLKSILRQMNTGYRNVIEFRHKTWWRKDVYARLRDSAVIFCSVSGPRLPEELVQTADDIYVRFHGLSRWYRHDYSREELAVWAERIRGTSFRNAWIYFNNDRQGYSIQNSRLLMRLLKLRTLPRTQPEQ